MSEQGNDAPVLVVGATGKQGGSTARALLAAGIPVRALVRDPGSERAKALVELGASLAVGDLYDADSLVQPCTGVRAVFSALTPDMMNPAADAERVHARNLIPAAVTAGVPHFVQTSVSGAGGHTSAPGWDEGRWHRSYHEAVAPISEYWESKEDVNDLVRKAGFLAWTILYPSTFMEMFLRPSVYFEDRTSNRLMAAVNPDSVYALVAVEDIGRAAAAAIADPERFNGVQLELAGDVLTFDEIAAALSRAWDEEILPPELPMSPEQALAKGMVAPIVQASEWNRDVPPTARREHLEKFGITPLDLETWARKTRESGR
ncbi:NmrA family NAD(P)-binding protein [Amycolatopsis sp. GM8]|uniref:NmrA family NAD(P)-binding protein n=1 Tax=Amycolatopsis sp. GM8 TaxID=2896530 RepID=UPI001F3F6629|nr:NmrA family NAD(P)-binding protein [Amycolatopsis sp. GM8]